MKTNALERIAWILVVVGALNWGLVGLFEYNLVEDLAGVGTTLTNVVYDLVGLSALYVAYAMWFAPRRRKK
jgi:uncharacterized protein